MLGGVADAGCGGGGGSGTDPDASTGDASGMSELPVGAACSVDPQCSGPGPDCIAERIEPLAEFASSENAAARQLARQVVIELPEGYCSNEAPCASDTDCGDEGQCFLPLTDVDEQEYRDLVEILGLSADETETLVAFHDYGQCLRPCTDAADCPRDGYVCAVPLADFLGMVENMGARMETYCIGDADGVCEPNPCVHGSCTVNPDATFTCECETGWTGELCDQEDPCDPSPCMHGGTCVAESGDASCVGCDPGWIGTDCDVDDPCDPDPCVHGSCGVQPDYSYRCACDAGWIGTDCDVDDPCDPDPCQHGGTCTVQSAQAVCTGCDPGWSGDLCDVPHDCGHPGAVSAPLSVDVSGGTTLGDTAVYSCDSGYVLSGVATRLCTPSGWSDTEPVCDPEPVTCQTGTCNGHGTCVEVGGVFDHCDCDPGYTGSTCGSLVDCGAPPTAPADGSVSYTSTTFGATATYGCDSGHVLVGASTVTCQADGTWSDSAPTCDPVDCGAPPAAPADGSVSYTDTTFGATATYDCDPGFDRVGAGSVTCQADGSWSDVAPTCEPSHCDVVYAVTGQFRVSDAPMSCGNTSSVAEQNQTTPSLEGSETTPFTHTSSFQRAFIRLRFPESGGDPAAGDVQLVEYYLPIEFVTNCTGATVTTDVDHSVGLLAMSGSPPEIPASPSVSRPCQGWATGALSGTTLDWSACTVVPPSSGLDWSHDDAQAGAGDTTTSCAMRMSVWGHVGCSGWACGFVPSTGNQRNTWDQLLNQFAFSGTAYRTATFSMPEVQIPESTSETETRTWITIDLATPIHVECGAAATLTCDEQAP